MARQLATMDIASGGRVTVGCGTGWMREEFEAVGAPPFAERGRVTDEFISAFRELWTNEEPSFTGDHVSFSNIYSRPLPVQRPHPPLWIGGDSPPALRRAARLGDGWYPVGADHRDDDPRYPLNTLERYGDAVIRLRALTEEAGRDPAAVTLAYWAVWHSDDADPRLDDGGQHMLLGSYDKIVEDIQAMAELGVTTVVFNFLRDTLAESQASMERFAEGVMPRVSSG